jgi:hypothetical protein
VLGVVVTAGHEPLPKGGVESFQPLLFDYVFETQILLVGGNL